MDAAFTEETMDTRTAHTADLVERLDQIRADLGSVWQPGWRSVVDEEAAGIISELESRDTGTARRALVDHGILDEEQA